MADDGLFPIEEGGPQNTAPSPQPSNKGEPQAGAQPNQGAPAGPPPIPQEVTQAFGQIGEALNQLGHRLEALEKGGSQSRGEPDVGHPQPSAPTDKDTIFQRLYDDPKGFMEEVARGASKEQLDQLIPYLQTTSTQVSNLIQDRVRNDFEKQFGEGSFKDILGERLTAAVDKLDPTHKADEQYIRALASGILGAQMQDPDGQKKIRDAMAKARQRAQAPVMLTGNRAAPPTDHLSADEKEFVRRANEAGIPMQESAYLDARNRGNSEEDWGATWMVPDELKPKPNGANKT